MKIDLVEDLIGLLETKATMMFCSGTVQSCCFVAISTRYLKFRATMLSMEFVQSFSQFLFCSRLQDSSFHSYLVSSGLRMCSKR